MVIYDYLLDSSMKLRKNNMKYLVIQMGGSIGEISNLQRYMVGLYIGPLILKRKQTILSVRPVSALPRQKKCIIKSVIEW